MRTLAASVLVLSLALSVVPALSAAGEVTLTGNIVCAKCVLKKADAKECQNVLVVKDKDAAQEYYIVKNAVGAKFGDVCTREIPASVTGVVADKDGKAWITPSKIEKLEKNGKTD